MNRYTNAIAAARLLLQSLSVKHSLTGLTQKLEDHPEYPSLYPGTSGNSNGNPCASGSCEAGGGFIVYQNSNGNQILGNCNQSGNSPGSHSACINTFRTKFLVLINLIIFFMKTLVLLSIILISSLCTFGSEKPTAYLNITIRNFSSLFIERFTFFETEREISVEKTGINNFLVKYFGDKPKLYYINFHEVLISPKDSVNILYEQSLLSTPDHHIDFLSVTGTNTENYTYSNHNRGLINGKIPKFSSEKYAQNVVLYYNLIKEIFESSKVKTIDSLKKLRINNDLKKYLIRRERISLFNEIRNIVEFGDVNLTQKTTLTTIADSLFSNINFVVSDTAFAYYDEFAIKNYFSMLIKNKYKNLKTERDFTDLLNWIKQERNDFKKKYFLYFLATDYQNFISKYNLSELSLLVSNNSFMGRQRYIYNNKKNIYWLD